MVNRAERGRQPATPLRWVGEGCEFVIVHHQPGDRGDEAYCGKPVSAGLAMLDNSCSCLRQFTPDVLKAIKFTGGTGTEEASERRIGGI
ncbi:hypothetical protein [Streptomyces nigrescens]|uniref:hypothetical protein n=1 Tax=Streptomyces nigrescens TaxID=1920 RepID=UPI0036F8F30C